MRVLQPICFAAHRGFTLIETITVMVMLGLAATTIVSLQGSIFRSSDDNENIQVGVQMMQECAELILATRRASGFDDPALASSAAATASCSGITLTGYAAPAVTLTAGNSTTANMGACPYSSGNNCKLISITQGGLTSVTLLLVN